MTEIEELINQAKAIKERWHKPKVEPKLTSRSWQEVLDGQPSPPLRYGKL